MRDTEPIYRNPRDYDLEHEGDDEDIAFYLRLATRLKPRRVLELACGAGVSPSRSPRWGPNAASTWSESNSRTRCCARRSGSARIRQ